MLARGGVDALRPVPTVGQPRHLTQRRTVFPGLEQLDQGHLPFAQHRHVDIRAIQRGPRGQGGMGAAQDDQRVGIMPLGDSAQPSSRTGSSGSWN